MTGDIFLPSMPQIADYFLVDGSKAQLSISFYLGGQILATLFWGALSDNIGRKKAFSMGMYLFFTGTIICIFSVSIYTFLLGRVIQGIGGVVAPVVGWEKWTPKMRQWCRIETIVVGVKNGSQKVQFRI
jgi:MFS family permease